jgi:hypothetical protein
MIDGIILCCEAFERYAETGVFINESTSSKIKFMLLNHKISSYNMRYCPFCGAEVKTFFYAKRDDE